MGNFCGARDPWQSTPCRASIAKQGVLCANFQNPAHRGFRWIIARRQAVTGSGTLESHVLLAVPGTAPQQPPDVLPERTGKGVSSIISGATQVCGGKSCKMAKHQYRCSSIIIKRALLLSWLLGRKKTLKNRKNRRYVYVFFSNRRSRKLYF